MKLIDFGIAKASAAGMQTMSGTIKGKFGYMAPEYLAGQIDARADLFALGIIAHELLTEPAAVPGPRRHGHAVSRAVDADRAAVDVEPDGAARDRLDRDDRARARSRCALAARRRDARRAHDRDEAARHDACSTSRSSSGCEWAVPADATRATCRRAAPTRVPGTSPSMSRVRRAAEPDVGRDRDAPTDVADREPPRTRAARRERSARSTRRCSAASRRRCHRPSERKLRARSR